MIASIVHHDPKKNSSIFVTLIIQIEQMAGSLQLSLFCSNFRSKLNTAFRNNYSGQTSGEIGRIDPFNIILTVAALGRSTLPIDHPQFRSFLGREAVH